MDSNADCADFADCNSSLLEVCSQLKHDKKFLEEENASLHNYLLMADDFIKEYSAKEYSMSQKLSSLSEAVVERDKLLEFVEKENLSRAAMQRLIDEQKYHNQQLEAKLAVTGDIEAVLNDKILKLEKELMKRDGQVKELFEIVRDYENILNENQEQMTEMTQELVMATSKLLQLREQIKDINENFNFMQISSSSAAESILSVLSYEGSNLPINAFNTDYDETESPVIQICNEQPWILIQSPNSSIHQKSLAEELFEVKASKDGASLANFKHGVGQFCRCVKCQNLITFRENTAMEFLRDLLIHLHTFKLMLIFRRNMFKRHDDYLLDYRQISKEKLSWSAENLNAFECQWETSCFNIIKQCEEILLLTGIHFGKVPRLWDEGVSDFKQRFLTLFTNRSTQLMKSRSAPEIFFSDVYNKKGRNTFNEVVNNEKNDGIHLLTSPNVTVRSLSTRSNILNDVQEKNTSVDNNSLKTIPASIEELIQIIVDQVNLLRGVNVGELGKFCTEISSIQEIRTHSEISTLLEYLETQINISVDCLTQRAHSSFIKHVGDIHNKIFGNTGEDTVNSFGEATSQNEIKSLSRNASASIDLRSQNSFNLKSNRNLQVFLCIPKNVSENVRNIQLSHSKLKDGNLSDHRNHILPDTHISSVIDGRSNNFMPLFIFCIFICFILLVSIDEFISFSDDSMFDCYILKSYLYLKHGIKNAYTKYLSIYTGLFDVSLIVQYSYGSPPI